LCIDLVNCSVGSNVCSFSTFVLHVLWLVMIRTTMCHSSLWRFSFINSTPIPMSVSILPNTL